MSAAELLRNLGDRLRSVGEYQQDVNERRSRHPRERRQRTAQEFWGRRRLKDGPTRQEREARRARRRKLGGDGMMTDMMREAFSEGERAVLTVIALDVKAAGRCIASNIEIARRGGCSPSTVHNARRTAERLGLIHVERRKLAPDLHDTNITTIGSEAWLTWIRFRPAVAAVGGGAKIKILQTYRDKKERNGARNEVLGGRKSERDSMARSVAAAIASTRWEDEAEARPAAYGGHVSAALKRKDGSGCWLGVSPPFGSFRFRIRSRCASAFAYASKALLKRCNTCNMQHSAG